MRDGKGNREVKQWQSKGRVAILRSDKIDFSQNLSDETKKFTYYNKRVTLLCYIGYNNYIYT